MAIITTKGREIPWDKMWEDLDKEYRRIFPKDPMVIKFVMKIIKEVPKI